MKLFWMKNKVLIATLCAVLVLGAVFWSGLRLFEGKAMEDAVVRTAYAEAEAKITAPDQAPAATPIPTELPPELLSADILGLEWKYRSVLPRISNTVPHEAKSWKEGDKVEDSLAVEAITRTKEIYEQLLGRKLDLYQFNVTRYVDEKGYRPNILRITGEKNDFVCVLRESDLSLLVADNGLFAASAWMDAKTDASNVAEHLGSQVTGKTQEHGSSRDRDHNIIELETGYQLSDGRWITLAYTRNTLHGIQVHEDERCMEESVCFLADITWNPSVVHLVAEACFERGDLDHIAEGDMTPSEVEAMYSRFLSAALGQHLDPDDPTKDIGYQLAPGQLVYYLDDSGIRENYYHIQDPFVIMDIAAKSVYIVHADCSKLYNQQYPELDLRKIDYDHMGGEEYIAYVRNIAEQTWGKENVKSVDVNAVYDGNYCTIDPFMTDGRWYEFCFAGGELTEIQHYASERSEVMGWAADSLYVNTVTGEQFYQEW